MKLKLTFIFFIYCIAILLYAQDTNTVENINETEDMDISARNQDNESVRVANDTTSHTGAVSTGYGTVKKEDLTVFVDHIDLENTESMAIANVERMLQGKACGVFAASGSGAPNAPVSVRIHGIGTPNNAEPLYIIDGMPVDEIHFWTNENPQGLSFLSPGDIESIQVLKDASACAMYGIRGANGVVIINTKKGNKGKPVIHFNGYFGNQRMPQNQRHELLNGQEFATLYNEATGVDIFDPATISSLPTTDWQGEIFRVAPIHNALLSLSGGSGMGNYYMSFNKFLQKGIIKHSGYNRYTFRINSEYQVSDWLRMGEFISLSNSKNRSQMERSLNGPVGAALQADTTASVHDDDPDTDWAPMLNTPQIPNPVGVIERQHNIYTSNRIQGSAFAEIDFGGIADFLEHLKYKLNAGLSRSWGNNEELQPAFYESPVIASSSSIKIIRQEDLNNFLLEHKLSYNFSIQKNHHFKAIGGYSVQKEKMEWTNITYNENEDDDIIASDTSSAEWKVASFMSGVHYNFRGKYLLNAAFRHDQSFYFKKKCLRDSFLLSPGHGKFRKNHS
ncbi:MAG: TonB-dependent receptor plug domain-containing protein [Bacteroidota bacterium]